MIQFFGLCFLFLFLFSRLLSSRPRMYMYVMVPSSTSLPPQYHLYVEGEAAGNQKCMYIPYKIWGRQLTHHELLPLDESAPRDIRSYVMV